MHLTNGWADSNKLLYIFSKFCEGGDVSVDLHDTTIITSSHKSKALSKTQVCRYIDEQPAYMICNDSSTNLSNSTFSIT